MCRCSAELPVSLHVVARTRQSIFPSLDRFSISACCDLPLFRRMRRLRSTARELDLEPNTGCYGLPLLSTFFEFHRPGATLSTPSWLGHVTDVARLLRAHASPACFSSSTIRAHLHCRLTSRPFRRTWLSLALIFVQLKATQRMPQFVACSHRQKQHGICSRMIGWRAGLYRSETAHRLTRFVGCAPSGIATVARNA